MIKTIIKIVNPAMKSTESAPESLIVHSRAFLLCITIRSFIIGKDSIDDHTVSLHQQGVVDIYEKSIAIRVIADGREEK
jgi:hypothetical protein